MQVTLGEALSVLAWLGTLAVGWVGFRIGLEKAQQGLKDQVTALQVAITREISKLDTELRLLGQSQGNEASAHKDRLQAVERAVDDCGRDSGKLDKRLQEVERQLAVLLAKDHVGMFSRESVASGDSGMSPQTRRPKS